MIHSIVFGIQYYDYDLGLQVWILKNTDPKMYSVHLDTEFLSIIDIFEAKWLL